MNSPDYSLDCLLFRFSHGVSMAIILGTADN